jgi:hypothetical protein
MMTSALNGIQTAVVRRDRILPAIQVKRACEALATGTVDELAAQLRLCFDQ